jgi:hypothetical protein
MVSKDFCDDVGDLVLFSSEPKERREFGFKDLSTMSMRARSQSQSRLRSLSKFAEMADKVNDVATVFFGKLAGKKRQIDLFSS